MKTFSVEFFDQVTIEFFRISVQAKNKTEAKKAALSMIEPTNVTLESVEVVN
jgi:hypothetical protein